jgi:hypothetical protein
MLQKGLLHRVVARRDHLSSHNVARPDQYVVGIAACMILSLSGSTWRLSCLFPRANNAYDARDSGGGVSEVAACAVDASLGWFRVRAPIGSLDADRRAPFIELVSRCAVC